MTKKRAAGAPRDSSAKKAECKLPAPGWLPNWKQRSEYQYLENASAQWWAWEFLRRNPNYIREHEAYANTPDDNDTAIPNIERKIRGLEMVTQWGLHSRLPHPIDPQTKAGSWCLTVWGVSATSVTEVTSD